MGSTVLGRGGSGRLADPVAATPLARGRDTKSGCEWFVVGIMVCATFLQRFGIPFGDQMIPVSGPIGLALAVYGVLAGTIAFNRWRLLIFMAFLLVVAVGGLHASLGAVPFGGLISIPSYIQFLGITAFTVFVFARPMDELAFFRIVSRYLLIIAFCGILQFVVQFAGVEVFKFGEFLPTAVVAEKGWNLQIPFGIGELFKSNGFFLVEPSVTSQFMAIALIIEVLYFRRLLHFAAIGLCFVLANSGTGALVLFGFIVAVVLRLGVKGLVLAGLTLAFAAVVAGAVLAFAPTIADIAVYRMGEFQSMGTSGHIRFVTPFWLLSDLFNAYPATALFGLGAGTSEKLTLPYDYAVNTPIKITLEFGFPALLLYVSLFLSGHRTPRQAVLVTPVLVLLMFTGGYQQYAPIVFFMTTLICTASLSLSAPASTKSDRRAVARSSAA